MSANNHRISEFSSNSHTTSRAIDSGAFKQILREKLDDLYFAKKDTLQLDDNATYELDLGEGESILSNVENRDLLMYLDEDEDSQQLRKDKFKAFARRYGLD